MGLFDGFGRGRKPSSPAGDWREQYETSADAELSHYEKASDSELLQLIQGGRTGEYYTIWRVIGSRPASPALCWTLYDILLSDRPYLDRYHCANALLQILPCTEFEAVQLSAAWPVLQENLARLQAVIERTVGPR